MASGAKGDRARRVSAVRRLLPSPATVEQKPIVLGPIRWVDVEGRALCRVWTAHWRRQYVEILPLVQTQQQVLPLPPPSCHSFSLPLELAGSTRPQCLVGTTATVCQRRWRSCLSSYEVKTTKEKLAAKKTFSLQGYNPLSGSAGRGSCVSFPQNLPFFSRGFLMS